MPSAQPLHRLFAPALFVFLWSTGFIAAKAGMPYAEPLTFLALRFGIVALLMLPFALAARVQWPRGVVAVHVAVVGLLIHTGYLGGVFVAIHRGVPAGLAALIVGAQPLLTALLARPFLGERVERRKWFGLALGFLGVGLVMADRLGFGDADALGLALCVMAVVAMAVGSLYQKRFCARVDLRSGAVIQYVAAALPVLALALHYETMVVHWSVPFLLAMAWLIVVLSIGAVSLLYVLIRRGAAAEVASLFYLVPPTTALMGYLLFGETLSPATILGMVLAALGVALVNRPAARGRTG